MPALPPAPGAIPGLAAIAARVHAGAGDAESPALPDPGLEQFAAHFQRLIGKPPIGGADAHHAQETSGAAVSDATPTADLAALLPFIEGLGLTQPPAAAGLPVSRGRAQAAAPDEAPFAAASSAGTTEAPGHGAARRLPPLPFPAASDPAAVAAAGSPMPPDAAPVEALVAGREFSAQRIGALSAAMEQSLPPGGLAAAGHAAIEAAAPRNVPAAAGHAVLREPVGSPGWGEEVGNRLVWLAQRAEGQAELVLNPPQMGRVEVSLALKGDQATASFAAANPVVREALEAALPRLREMLAEAGIQLGQAQVGAENSRQWAQQQKHGDNSALDPARASFANAALSSVSLGGPSTGLKGGRGLVDVYA